MPEKMTELRQALGLPDDELRPHIARLAQWNELGGGLETRKLQSLFPRVDRQAEPAAAEPKTTAPNTRPDEPEGVASMIDIEAFSNVDLRVAIVQTAEPIPNADRLLRLEIDLGAETRQLVAGIAKHYTPDELLGRRIVVVANLKPATLKGVESQGMLLAAKSGKELSLLTIDAELPPGSKVG